MPRLFGRASAGRYAFIGVCGVTLDTVLFALLVALGLLPVVATMISTSAGIANNYVLNARYNFGTTVDLVSGRRFVTVGLLGLVVAAVSLQMLVGLGLEPLPAKLVSLPVVIAGQFLANKKWSFAA